MSHPLWITLSCHECRCRRAFQGFVLDFFTITIPLGALYMENICGRIASIMVLRQLPAWALGDVR